MRHGEKTIPVNTEYHEDTGYRIAAGLASVTAFVLFWLTAGAGIIGDGAVNLLYLGVLALGCAGSVFVGFKPHGLAIVLLAMATAQFVVPVAALGIWKAGWVALLTSPKSSHLPFHPGIGPVFGLNTVFVVLWTVAAGLFHRVSQRQVRST